MSPAEFVENALIISNRIDVQWGLFVTVHLAILGVITYVDEPLHKIEKLTAILIYTGFALVNYAQMQSQLELLNAIYTDIHQLALDGNPLTTIQFMSQDHEAGRFRYSQWVVNISHGLMGVLVVLAIMFHPLMTKETVASPAE